MKIIATTLAATILILGLWTYTQSRTIIVDRNGTLEERVTALEEFVEEWVDADNNSTIRPILQINNR